MKKFTLKNFQTVLDWFSTKNQDISFSSKMHKLLQNMEDLSTTKRTRTLVSNSSLTRPGEISSDIAQNPSFLSDETVKMEHERRQMEQDGIRRSLGLTVIAREHAAEVSSNPEQAPENGMLQHPDLDSQLFDGIDPNVNPNPVFNPLSEVEYENQQREQELKKQHKLDLNYNPKFNPKPGF